MRYIVYLLIIANLALFVWYRFSPPVATDISYPLATPPGINRLVMLSERKETKEMSASSDAQTDSAQQLASSKSNDNVTADTALSAQIEPQIDENELASVPEAEPEQICQTVGPFLDRKDVTSVFKSLATKGYILNIRDGDVRAPNGYWVYLPAMSATRARAIVADLDTHGMKDYFIGKQNHISLGIFSDVEKARIRQRTVKKLGYDAILDPRYRMRDVFWLDVDRAGEPLLGSGLWEKIQAEQPEIRVQRVSCE